MIEIMDEKEKDSQEELKLLFIALNQCESDVESFRIAFERAISKRENVMQHIRRWVKCNPCT
jgi:hypothetical protein